MDKQTAINLLDNLVGMVEDNQGNDYNTALKMGIEALKADVQHWISCSERLPFAEYGEGDTVLTTCGYRNGENTSARWLKMLYFNGGNWCFPTGETYEEKIYAWMPLPEPYKDGDEDE